MDRHVRIANRKNFCAGQNSALYHGTYVQNNFGEFHLGSDAHLGAMCYVNVQQGKCIIGDHTSIGPGCMIIVYSNDFAPQQLNSKLRTTKDIHIGRNVFIGANATILPGSTIGDNTVVGAGAVVKGSLEPNSVYAGVPARKLKELI